MEQIITRKCTKCGVDKPLEQYSKHQGGLYGRRSVCKECTSVLSKEYEARNKDKIAQYLADHREHRCEYMRAYYQAHKEVHAVQGKEWREKNKAKSPEYSRRHYARHPERVRAASQAWMDRHPGKAVEYKENRRARLASSEGKVTASEWRALQEKYGNKCVSCGRDDTRLTMDHVIPLVLGGPHTIDNIQPLCPRCNSVKHVHHIDYR